MAQGAGGELSVAVARQGALSLGGGAVASGVGAAGEGGALDLATDTSIGSPTPVTDFLFKAVVVLGIIAAIYLASAGILAALASP